MGIEPAVAAFDEWMPLLVLRACLVLGLFSEPGASATPQQLAQQIIPEYRRFTSEMTAMLQRAGACPAYVQYCECDIGEWIMSGQSAHGCRSASCCTPPVNLSC